MRPARDSSALLIIVFAAMLSVSLRAGPYGLYGLPVTLLLVSWFFKYAFVLFDHVVPGFADRLPTDPHVEAARRLASELAD
jgi:hypothetical protein